jgi:hypothetical protein
MRNFRGQELELLEQRLSELLRNATAVRRSLGAVSVNDFVGEPLEGGLRELAMFMATTVGDVSHRLGQMDEILTGLGEQAII